MSTSAGFVKRRAAIAILSIHMGTRLDQRIHNSHMVIQAGKMKERVAIAVNSIYIGTDLDH